MHWNITFNRTNYRLIVENLSSSVSWQDLKDYMRKAGEVNYADAHKNRQNEGIIEFTSRSVLATWFGKADLSACSAFIPHRDSLELQRGMPR